jgi:hypothetical protein
MIFGLLASYEETAGCTLVETNSSPPSSHVFVSTMLSLSGLQRKEMDPLAVDYRPSASAARLRLANFGLYHDHPTRTGDDAGLWGPGVGGLGHWAITWACIHS